MTFLPLLSLVLQAFLSEPAPAVLARFSARNHNCIPRRTVAYKFAVLSVFLLAACVPQVELGPRAIVVGGPTEYRASGLADIFQAQLRDLSSPSELGFVGRGATAFQETHRDMYGVRAARQTAIIARSVGAEMAVLVGAPILRRKVSEVRAGTPKRIVNTAVQIRVFLLDPATADIIATYDSRRYDTVRLEVNQDLVAEDDDPDLLASLLRATRELAPAVASDLALLAGRIEAERFTDYACEDGSVISVAYPDNAVATLRYQGQSFTLNTVNSASGARYVGAGLVWWIKGTGAGSEGSLYRLTDEG